MKTSLLVLLGICKISAILGQDCPYDEYFILSEIAAKDFAENKYKGAQMNLTNAFSKTDFPLGEELHLALQVSQKTRDYDWAEEISITLAKGGVPLRYFKHLHYMPWYNKFASNYDEYNKYYVDNFKPQLKDKLNLLIIRDAAFTRELTEWHLGNTVLTAEDAIEEANSILSELKALTNEFGFPSERNMGYNYVKRLNRVEDYKMDVLLIHIYKWELVYEDQIADFICNGLLHRNLAEILRKNRGFGDSTGIEQEMLERNKKYNSRK